MIREYLLDFVVGKFFNKKYLSSYILHCVFTRRNFLSLKILLENVIKSNIYVNILYFIYFFTFPNTLNLLFVLHKSSHCATEQSPLKRKPKAENYLKYISSIIQSSLNQNSFPWYFTSEPNSFHVFGLVLPLSLSPLSIG